MSHALCLAQLYWHHFIRNAHRISAMALGLGIWLFASVAWAQATGAMPDLPTMQGIEAAAQSVEKDTSRKILSLLFGEFGEKPFAAVGAANTFLGNLFFTFNAVLFVIATAYLGYQMVAGIASSAHEGEVLGKRMNSLWAPIRIGVGVFGMLPVFKGFSVAQSVVMFSAILGVGMANLMVDSAIDSANEKFLPLIQPPGLAGGVQLTLTDDMVHSIFAMNVCTLAVNENKAGFFQKFAATANAIGLNSLSVQTVATEKGIETFTGGFGPDCGSLLISFDESKIREDTTWTIPVINYQMPGSDYFVNQGVNHEAINESTKAKAKMRLDTLRDAQKEISGLALKWFSKSNSDPQPYPYAEIDAVIKDLIAKENKAAQEIINEKKNEKGFKEGITDRMKEGGWLSIGGWYSAFAEHDAAMQSAFTAFNMKLNKPNFSGVKIPESMDKVFLEMARTQGEEIKKNQDDCTIFPRNALGTCSFGQGVALSLIGTLSSGGEGMVNPIMTAKNIGDYLLTTAGGFLTLAGVNEVSSWFGDDESENESGKDKGWAGKASDSVGSLLTRMFGVLFPLLIILGLVFAVYIPLIPFITWFTAVVSYFSHAIEGLVGAQVWMFSHLSTEGEGMGQKTEKGYIYILNMILRPALMVLGFFFAAALMTLMATFLFQQFGTAIANMQGNTGTGPFIIIGILFIYMMLLIVLIQTVCNLIYEIPDRVISWFGHSFDAKLAKEMDGKAEGKMDSSAQWSGRTATTMMARGGA